MGPIYSIQKQADGWVISVGNNQLLRCSKRATAICVIEQAAHRLGLPDDAVISSSDVPSDQTGETVRIWRIA